VPPWNQIEAAGEDRSYLGRESGRSAGAVRLNLCYGVGIGSERYRKLNTSRVVLVLVPPSPSFCPLCLKGCRAFKVYVIFLVSLTVFIVVLSESPSPARGMASREKRLHLSLSRVYYEKN
jgi:hypothetical protein